METGDEQRPIGETAFGGQSGDDLSWQTTDAKAPIHTDRIASAVNSATPIQRITPFTDDIRPQPGSNVERIYGLSDCVIAVAFTLIVVNIKLPPAGLGESQLRSFVLHDILPNVPFYLVSYIIFASSWISHYRIFILLNVLFLASIVFLPVPVAFFFYYGNQAGSLQLFACTQLVTSVALLLMWVVARGDHLLDPVTLSEYLRYTTARLIIIPLGTLLNNRSRILQRLVRRGHLSLLFRPGVVLARRLLSPQLREGLLGRDHAHVLDHRQHDGGSDHISDCDYYGHTPVRQSAASFDVAYGGSG